MRTTLFCSVDYVPKIKTKRDMRCCELPYVTAEGDFRRRAHFASLSIARSNQHPKRFRRNLNSAAELHTPLITLGWEKFQKTNFQDSVSFYPDEYEYKSHFFSSRQHFPKSYNKSLKTANYAVYRLSLR